MAAQRSIAGDLAVNFGLGIAAGLCILSISSLLLIPASYSMNRFIYHSAPMRIIIGLLSLPLFIVLVPMVWFEQIPKVPYFGLFPARSPPATTGLKSGSYFASVFNLIELFLDPFNTYNVKADYLKLIDHMLVKEGEAQTKTLNGKDFMVTSGAVSEEFFEAARELGTKVEFNLWKEAHATIKDSGIGKIIFSPVGSLASNQNQSTSPSPNQSL